MKSLQPKTSQMLAHRPLKYAWRLVSNVILVNKICWLFCENSHLAKQEEAEDNLLLQSNKTGFIFVSVGGHSTLVQVLWMQIIDQYMQAVALICLTHGGTG